MQRCSHFFTIEFTANHLETWFLPKKLSKSMPAHDAVAAVLSHRHHWIIHVCAGHIPLVYAGYLLLAWDVIFGLKKTKEIVCIFSFFDGGESVCGCMCVYTHTHTQTARGVLWCEPRGRDETLGQPKESIWTKTRHIFINGENNRTLGRPKINYWNNSFSPRRCKTSFVGQSAGLSISRSSVRFQPKIQHREINWFLDVEVIECI